MKRIAFFLFLGLSTISVKAQFPGQPYWNSRWGGNYGWGGGNYYAYNSYNTFPYNYYGGGNYMYSHGNFRFVRDLVNLSVYLANENRLVYTTPIVNVSNGNVFTYTANVQAPVAMANNCVTCAATTTITQSYTLHWVQKTITTYDWYCEEYQVNGVWYYKTDQFGNKNCQWLESSVKTEWVLE